MIVVTADGRAIQDDREPRFRVIKDLIDGYVTCVPRMFALCDEDAAMRQKPLNKTASNWVQFPIYGDVVFLTHKEWNFFTSEHE